MNDPSKRIDVNLSSLLSLKAELLRKQEEVNKAKNQKPNPTEFVPKRIVNDRNLLTKKVKENEKQSTSSEKGQPKKFSDEDSELLLKSRKILEAKSKLYYRMTNSGGGTNSDDTCLVLFNQKKQENLSSNVPADASDSSDTYSDSESSSDSNPENQWTEYTDCLGRTRKCLKKDLEFFKRKDVELAEATRNRIHSEQNDKPTSCNNDLTEAERQSWVIDTKGISSNDLPLQQPTAGDDTVSLISKSSKMEEMRMQWEQKEQENLNRDDIHYQDVLFDEARTHGVGYYAFSVDQEERAKQQKQLDEEREHTLTAQKQREEQRQMREKAIADRVFAAKNRQRARLGLSPLEKPESNASDDDDNSETEEERKQRRKQEKETKKMRKLRRNVKKNERTTFDHGIKERLECQRVNRTVIQMITNGITNLNGLNRCLKNNGMRKSAQSEYRNLLHFLSHHLLRPPIGLQLLKQRTLSVEMQPKLICTMSPFEMN